MNSNRLLAKLNALGVKLWEEKGTLKYRSPPGVFSNDLKEKVQLNKQDIIDSLRASNELALPVSAAQRRIWLSEQYSESQSVYNVPLVWKVRGGIDINRLEKAIIKLTDDNDVFRQAFYLANGELSCRFNSRVNFKLECGKETKEISEIVSNVNLYSEQNLTRISEMSIVTRPFNFEEPPLLRGEYYDLDEVGTIIVLVFHHLIIDEYSFSIFLEQLKKNYSGSKSERLTIRAYQDYIFEEIASKSKSCYANRLARKRELLSRGPEILPLPYASKYTEVKDDASSLVLKIPHDKSQKISRVIKDLKITDFIYMLGTFFILLKSLTKKNKLHVSCPVHGVRDFFEELSVGLYQNVSIINTEIHPELTFREYLQAVKLTVQDCLDNRDLLFEDVVRRDSSTLNSSVRIPYFQLLFFKQASINNSFSIEGASLEQIVIPNSEAKSDLLIGFTHHNGEFVFSLQYRKSAFDFETMRRLRDGYKFLLTQCIDETGNSIQEISNRVENVLTGNARSNKRKTSGLTKYTEQYNSVWELIVSSAKSNLDTLVFEDDKPITYRELLEQVERHATSLSRFGNLNTQNIGVYLDRSPSLVISVLAILKVGGCFILLDERLPTKRIEDICQQAEVSYIIARTEKLNRKLVPGTTIIDVNSLDLSRPVIEQAFTPSISNKQLAYIMFTSGTTGKPKGVCVSHRGLLSFLSWTHSYFDNEVFRSLYSLTPVSFDVAIFEIFATLCAGGTFRFVGDLKELSNTAIRSNSSLTAVPSVLSQYLLGNKLSDNVSSVYLAGEKIDTRLMSLINKKSKIRTIYNLYGPTEAVVYTTSHRLTENTDTETIGEPRDDLTCYVIDEQLDLVRDGEVGQMAISGTGISSGYFGRSRETALSFVPSPFSTEQGSRMYLTGDLVRKNSKGLFEYVGRIDDQIKVNGVRIEPKEIECILYSHPSINFSLVYKSESENGSLIGAIVKLEENSELSLIQLRQFCIERLPLYMVPHVFYIVDKVPLNSTGKVDKVRIISAAEKDSVEKFTDAGNAKYVVQVRELWKKVLDISSFSDKKNFFEVGGGSQQLIVLRELLNKQFSISTSVMELFNYPTVNEMSNLVATKLGHRHLSSRDSKKRSVRRKQAMSNFKSRSIKDAI